MSCFHLVKQISVQLVSYVIELVFQLGAVNPKLIKQLNNGYLVYKKKSVLLIKF